MLTPELVEHRALTLMEALFSADKRQRGHVNYDKVLQVYSLFLHGATGTLHEEELGDFVAQYAFHAAGGAELVVDYERLVAALRIRDLDLMRAEGRSLRPTGEPDLQRSPPKGKNGAGVHAALHMDEAAELLANPPLRANIYESASPNRRLAIGAGRIGGSGGYPDAGTPAYPRDEAHQLMGAQHAAAAASGPNDGASAAVRGVGAAAASSLIDLLRAAEAVDEQRSGRIYSSQLLTCCRLQGLEEPSLLLRTTVKACEDSDGRVDYHRFVQQLAAQRADNAAAVLLSRGDISESLASVHVVAPYM